MKYIKFRIINYRGIDDTTIDLPQSDGARVTTLIGLNESGKTTILEAIYSFSPDPESKVLYADNPLLSDDPAYYIPRGEFSNFTGDIVVEATVRWEEGERESFLKSSKTDLGIELDLGVISSTFTIRSTRTYKASRLVERTNYWSFAFSGKTGKQKNFRPLSLMERRAVFARAVTLLPDIAYFPTFVFNFPERIYLKGGPDKPVNRFYKKIFEAILDAGGDGHTIDEHIVKRYESITASANQSLVAKAIDTAAAMMGARSAVEMIKQTVDKAADTVSDVIIARWDDIFKHSPLKKEILIDSFERFEESENDDGELEKQHVVWVEFKVKDSGTRYNISDRSLGFRWFFCFLLFTRFMANSKNRKKMLFLFDEPASNLHAKAQEKLLETFSDISKDPNSLIFSTHSHYMVEPTWLDRAYVVKNDAIDYSDATGEQKHVKGVRIEAVRYRDFVSQADETLGRMTYFQPVLDRLDIKPSKLDVQSECIVVEGKSDFHILTYIKRNYAKTALPIVPAFGATTMRPVIGILRGWASRFIVVLDGDQEGRDAADTYRAELDLGVEVRLLSDFPSGAVEIEKLISAEDRDKIKQALKLSAPPSKKQIGRLFQEANASVTKLPLTRVTIDRLKKLLGEFDSAVSALPG